MPLNLKFGPAVLQPGTPFESATYTVKNTDSLCTLGVDRTVPGGFNSLDASAEADIVINFSADGGQSWHLLAGAGITGGVFQYTDRSTGQLVTVSTSTVNVGLDLAKGVLLKATVTVSAPVAVAGSLVIT